MIDDDFFYNYESFSDIDDDTLLALQESEKERFEIENKILMGESFYEC